VIHEKFKKQNDFVGKKKTTQQKGVSSSLSKGRPMKELIKNVGVIKFSGKKTERVYHLTLDSRKVIPGSLFFAVRGLKDDGNYYVNEAIHRGAVGIISEKHVNVKNAICIQVEDVRLAMAQISQRFYDYPDKKLHLIGVTGTNGKTTVVSLAQYLLKHSSDDPVGLIGTVKYDLGTRTLPSAKTTPESLDIYNMLDQMVSVDCKSAAVEVSSHAVALKRVQGMAFDIGVFLNLTEEHLDFHENMETYFEDKARFFMAEVGNHLGKALISIDDPYGKRLFEKIANSVQKITFGFAKNANVRAENVEMDEKGVRFDLYWPGGHSKVQSPLLGNYNVLNILASLAIAWASGLNLHELCPKLKDYPGVRGRMEKIDIGQPYTVLVDYAHTDDALRNGLKMLRKITTGRLLVVFGCGGNRDRTKRPKMMEAVQSFADLAWATADNPRKESLDVIFDDMRKGVSKPEKIFFVSERRRAIDKGLNEAKAGDCLLIAGKGHETYQELADTVIPFDDRQVVKELLQYKRKHLTSHAPL